jgi:hypothetical protein
MKEFMTIAISTRKQAVEFVNQLNENSMLFHFDDDPADILSNRSGHSEALFTEEECVYVAKRVEEMFDTIGYDDAMQLLCDAYDELS